MFAEENLYTWMLNARKMWETFTCTVLIYLSKWISWITIVSFSIGGHRSLWHFLKNMTRIIRLWYWFWNNILAFFTGPHERMSGKTTDDILYHSVRFCKESILSGKLKIPFLHWIWRYLRQWIKELWVKTVLSAVTVMGNKGKACSRLWFMWV